VHREAGAWLARLHRLPVTDDDPLPLAEAYRRRADAWIGRARDLLPAATLRSVRSCLDEALPRLEARRRVPCHRDMGPRNWLVADGRLRAVIDFEHARPDVAEVDVARLATTVWPRRPEFRAAFLAGYAQADGPGDPEAPWVRGLLVLEALGTVVWAVEHGDASFELRGRAALARLLDDTLA
jgi:Ser/Thr protein kinase RdoA (MazF antagonist)